MSLYLHLARAALVAGGEEGLLELEAECARLRAARASMAASSSAVPGKGGDDKWHGRNERGASGEAAPEMARGSSDLTSAKMEDSQYLSLRRLVREKLSTPPAKRRPGSS